MSIVDLNYAFDVANRAGDIEAIRELLKRPIRAYTIKLAADNPGHPEILALILKSQRLLNVVSPTELKNYNKLYTYLRSMEYLDYDNIIKICRTDTKLYNICKSPYVRKLIEQRQHHNVQDSEQDEELLEQDVRRYLENWRIWSFLTLDERDVYLRLWDRLEQKEKEEYLQKLRFLAQTIN